MKILGDSETESGVFLDPFKMISLKASVFEYFSLPQLPANFQVGDARIILRISEISSPN